MKRRQTLLAESNPGCLCRANARHSLRFKFTPPPPPPVVIR
jgi:hypothetical protein